MLNDTSVLSALRNAKALRRRYFIADENGGAHNPVRDALGQQWSDAEDFEKSLQVQTLVDALAKLRSTIRIAASGEETEQSLAREIMRLHGMLRRSGQPTRKLVRAIERCLDRCWEEAALWPHDRIGPDVIPRLESVLVWARASLN